MDNTPQRLVSDYLAAAGDQRIDEATGYLATDVILAFPHGQFADLASMTNSAIGRYTTISKTHETWDVLLSDHESVVVTTGTLSGVNMHGVEFAGIRFCDRFVVRRGQIAEQHVWNDLAESGVLDMTTPAL